MNKYIKPILLVAVLVVGFIGVVFFDINTVDDAEISYKDSSSKTVASDAFTVDAASSISISNSNSNSISKTELVIDDQSLQLPDRETSIDEFSLQGVEEVNKDSKGLSEVFFGEFNLRENNSHNMELVFEESKKIDDDLVEPIRWRDAERYIDENVLASSLEDADVAELARLSKGLEGEDKLKFQLHVMTKINLNRGVDWEKLYEQQR